MNSPWQKKKYQRRLYKSSIERGSHSLALTVFISLSLLLAMSARIALRTVHSFEAVFSVTVSVVLYLTYCGIVYFNYRVFAPSPQLGPFGCFLIMGFITVPSVVLISISLVRWRDRIWWKLTVWLGSVGMLLGIETVAIDGNAIYYDFSFQSRFIVWIGYLTVLHILVHLYRRLLRKEVRLL